MKIEITDTLKDVIIKGELARRYMVEISGHFVQNKTLSKDDFFKLGKRVVIESKKEVNKQLKKENKRQI